MEPHRANHVVLAAGEASPPVAVPPEGAPPETFQLLLQSGDAAGNIISSQSLETSRGHVEKETVISTSTSDISAPSGSDISKAGDITSQSRSSTQGNDDAPEIGSDESAFQALAGILAATILQLTVPEATEIGGVLASRAAGEVLAHGAISPDRTKAAVGGRFVVPALALRQDEADGLAASAEPPDSKGALSGLFSPSGAEHVTGERIPELTAAPTPLPSHANPSTEYSEKTAGPSQPSVPPDIGRLVKRVARAFSLAEQNDGTVRLRLNPPELGSLQLELRIENGSLVTLLRAESADVRDLLLGNVELLQERLAQQGFRVERFEVELMQHHSGDRPHTPPDRPSMPAPRTMPEAPQQTQESTAVRSPFPRRKPGRLNVII